MQTLIDAVLTDMGSKSNYDAPVARYIQSLTDEAPDMRVADAYEDFHTQRLEAVESEKLNGVRGKDPIIAPEYMMSFIQHVMNNIMWKSRRLRNSIDNQAEFDNRTSGGTGQDYANDLCEEMGIAPVDFDGLVQLVNDDFAKLQFIHSEITKDCSSYLDDVPAFAYFVENAPDDDGVWHEVARLESFDDALSHIEEVAVKLREQQSAERRSRFRRAA